MMKNVMRLMAGIVIVSLLFSSCSKDDEINKGLDGESATLSFGSLLNDLLTENGLKQQLEDIPDCSDDLPAYVEVALSQDDTWVVGTDTAPLRVDINPTPADFDGDGVDNYFTEEATELELVPGTYSLEYFTVHNADGDIIWQAPRTQGSFGGAVDAALPLEISLSAGTKKYVSVDVLCFDNRFVNEYGYLFFDIGENEAIEFCVFGNFCDETGRHFPAHFRVDAWIFSGDEESPEGAFIGEETNNVGVNNDGDAFADPVCLFLPNTSGTDLYYLEITLLESDAYNTEERVIRSGIISDEDVQSFFAGDDAVEYYHFREGACEAADSPPLFLDVDLELVADGMTSPLGVVAAPGDTARLYVIDQTGEIWVIENGVRNPEPFLDVSASMVPLGAGYDERGLLGLAFHPDFMSNNRFFVYYTAPPGPGGPEEGEEWNNRSRISEFTALNPDNADPGSEEIILEVDQPQGNHEGGTIAFGPDGFLYISIGDGGASNDVGPGHVEDWYEVNAGGNGQDTEANLLGDILRIDVDGAAPYGIPAGNPFVGEDGLDEIYAFGFRNPYRFSFDIGGTHELFVGDAGQGLYEEVSIVENGGNYGWNVKEGTHCFNAADNTTVLPNCPDFDEEGNPLIDPVIEMRHVNNPEGGETIVIVGGYVYRGDAIPDFEGKYIFGSFANSFAPTGELFIAEPGAGLWEFHEIHLASRGDHLGEFIKGFGQDLAGEVYVTTSTELGPTGNTGKVYKLVP